MTSTDEAAHCDVLIVGCGPVGKLLALLLAHRGLEVIAVDRRPEAYPLPRAVTHDSEFARALQAVGLAPDTIPHITAPYDDMYVWRNQHQQTLVEVDWRGTGPSGWNNTWFFHQPALERRLEELIAEHPTIAIRRGWTATGHRAGVETDTITGLDAVGRPDRITARYVVGADGANSAVRQWMGSAWHDLGYFYDWLVVDVRPDPALAFPHIAQQSCDPARPATMVPGGPGRRRWEFMRLPGESVVELDNPETAWRLLAPFGIDEGNATLERHSVYTFQAGWAVDWRRGRLLLAGDAAHLMPPFAGQGLGAGVRDALNLAWKLAFAVRSGRSTVLDSYGAERIPHVAQFVDFSMELGRIICITDEAEARSRDARMIESWRAAHEAPAPPRPALGPGIHQGSNGGGISVQGVVRDEAGAGRLDDVLGGAGVLLLRDPADLSLIAPRDRVELAAREIAVIALAENPGPDRVVDVDGTYAAWLRQLGACAVLVRPDFYVFATAAARDEVAALARDFVAATA